MIQLNDARICMSINDRSAVTNNTILNDSLTSALNYVLEVNDYTDKITDSAKLTVAIDNDKCNICIFGYLDNMTEYIEHQENLTTWLNLMAE